MTTAPVLVLLCGLSFSGKSTLAAAITERLRASLVGLDRINAERGLDGGRGIPLEEWATTNRIAHERAAALLAAGTDVVVDDTGSPRFIRDAWREVAESAGSRFAIVWVRIDGGLQRERVLANRSEAVRNDVVDRVLADHAAAFEDPADEDPIVVDARDTRDDAVIDAVVAELRGR